LRRTQDRRLKSNQSANGGKSAAPLLKSAERIFQRPAFAEALTPAEKAMRK